MGKDNSPEPLDKMPETGFTIECNKCGNIVIIPKEVSKEDNVSLRCDGVEAILMCNLCRNGICGG